MNNIEIFEIRDIADIIYEFKKSIEYYENVVKEINRLSDEFNNDVIPYLNFYFYQHYGEDIDFGVGILFNKFLFDRNDSCIEFYTDDM